MEDNLLKRISVLGLILALLFGILQYIPSNKTYDFLTIEAVLKILALVFFQTILIAVLIYLILIGLNLGYGMGSIIPERLLKWIYNAIILTSFLAILITVFITILINLVIIIPAFTPRIASYALIIFFLFWVLSFTILFGKYV